MTIAIMQPYFLPYIGYWQLLASVDTFVLLDEVHFINRGWINRNRITLQGASAWITLPLVKASQNRRIDEIEINGEMRWQRKMEGTIRSAYGKSPNFQEGWDLFERILRNDSSNLASFLEKSITLVAEHLGISTRIIRSSEIVFEGDRGKGQDRILRICRELGASRYRNLPGGSDLYHRQEFSKAGIDLQFLETDWESVGLASGGDQPTDSILDLIMHNPPGEIRKALSACRFV